MIHKLPTTIRLADWTHTLTRSALQDMLALTARPGLLSFALGLPFPELFPKADLIQASTQVLSTDPRALQYGPSLQSLKTHIVTLMSHRSVHCTEEQVFLTAGAQQGVNLLARLLLNQGGQVMMEQLTYTGFQQVIEPFQPHLWTVGTDPQTGMDVDEVELLLAKGAHPSFIYAITDGHNPLGVSMSAAKRALLVALAQKYHVPIIEDDAYGLLSYEKTSIPPMRALDEQWVFYVGSFSKILAPALRVGWLIVPEALIAKLSSVKEASDIDSATLSQRIVSTYIDTGHLNAHLTTLRREYNAHRNVMLQALQNHFPDKARWQKPTHGFFIWVELPEEVNTTELLTLAMETKHVAFIPGHAFSVAGRRCATNCMRLSFSNCTTELIEDGIARLGQVLHF